jgi:hypothetical protein
MREVTKEKMGAKEVEIVVAKKFGLDLKKIHY